MVTYNIDFNICALFLCIAMLFNFYTKKFIPSAQNKIFSVILWLCFISIVTEIIDCLLPLYKGEIPKLVRELILYIFFVCINAIPVFYVFYIIMLTNVGEKVFGRLRKFYIFIPLIIGVGVIFINPWTNFLFDFDEAGIYKRGSGVIILNVIAVYYGILAIIYAFTNRKMISKEKRLCIYGFPFFAMIPSIIQIHFPGILITLFGITICIYLIFNTIQKPEEVISATGLLNRNALLTTASIYYNRKESFSAIDIYVDNYSYIKRVFGENTTLEYIKHLGYLLERFPLKGKIVYYVGNGSFLFFLPTKSIDEGLPHKILSLFDENIIIQDMNFKFSGKARVILCPENAPDIDSLMAHIEYKDGLEEKGKKIYYAKDMKLASIKRVEKIEKMVEKALVHGGLQVYYQPIYSLDTGKVNSAEALIRLFDEEEGMIFPDEFISISEKNGAIIRIGEYVLKSVCEFIKANDLKKYGIQYIEINLSVAQCLQEKLEEKFSQILEEYNVSPEYINLEITESIAANPIYFLEENMNKLISKGFRFSLDDFGTGFSNMSSIVDFPFSIVKIDRTIINGLDSPKTQILIKNIISMLKKMNLEIVAEGVETIEQLNMLKDMNCNYIQGYFFSKPIMKNEFLEKVQEINDQKWFA